MYEKGFRVAIDIGTTKVCTIIVRGRDDHRVDLAGISTIPCAGMSKGTIIDSQSVINAIRKSVRDASADAGVKIKNVYAGLTGSHIVSKNYWVNVPRAEGVRAVTDSDLSTALEAASNFNLEDDRKLLHVIPRSYALDGLHGVRNPLGMHTGELHVESHVITGSISKIAELKNAITHAGVDVSSMVVEPVASADVLLTADEREEGAVLVDVGGGTCDIAVYHAGTIVHTAIVPIGGFQFSNDLSVAFAIDFESAERLKIQKGTAAPELAGLNEEVILHPNTMRQPLTVTRREVGQVLKERAMELFRMIQLKLEEPHLADVPIERIVFTGGGAKLEGFLNVAKYIFQRKVRLTTARGLEGMPADTNDPCYSAAAGVALWGIRNLSLENHISRQFWATNYGTAAQMAKPLIGRLTTIRSWLPKNEKETADV